MRPRTLCLAMLLAPAVLLAQKLPKRPKLADGDTNDARTYLQVGDFLLTRDASSAADAFYWATRIDPTLSEAHYGRWVAVLMSQQRTLLLYWTGSRRVIQSEEMQRNDSSLSLALQLNPMMIQRYERTLSVAVIKASIEDAGGPQLTLTEEAELDRSFNRYVRGAMDADLLRAQVAESDGNRTDALRYYASAIKHASKKAEIRAARGRLFLRVGEPDSAIAELGLALTELRKRDKKDFVVFYNSKANLELMIGIAQRNKENVAESRAAFGRALEEDLAYYPAHVKLGFLALDQKDTLTALSEFDLAVQLRATDGFLRQQYGFALLTAGKYVAAAEQLKKASELEPYFALPQRNLGEAYERLDNRAGAAAAYKAFLAISSKSDPARADVLQRLALLGSP